MLGDSDDYLVVVAFIHLQNIIESIRQVMLIGLFFKPVEKYSEDVLDQILGISEPELLNPIPANLNPSLFFNNIILLIDLLQFAVELVLSL